jgi:hypothetical protein
MPLRDDTVTDQVPGSPGGVVEAVKRATIVALRTGLTGTSLTDKSNAIHVDMEYPVEQTQYPGIWVQFSLTKLEPSGLGHMTATHDEDGNVTQMIQQYWYEGRVTLFLVALTSIERDRLADRVIAMLSTPQISSRNGVLTVNQESDPAPMFQSLVDNPYVAMTINTDAPRPGGQTVTVGVPWDERALAYEDSYSFELVGEFQTVTDPAGLVTLSRIDIVPELAEDQTQNTRPFNSLTPGTWF